VASSVDDASVPPFGGASRSGEAVPVEEFGPYLVYEQLGYGGMASVHRAEARGAHGFRRTIALKRMHPSVAGNPDLVQSFIREARLASYLHHANVAQTYDLGKVGDTYFIAMELVPGKNLREVLRHCSRTRSPVPLPIVLEILSQTCEALDYAHGLCDESGQQLGIVHRDVSPSNIILSEGGIVKLIDFGIAKATAVGMQTLSGTIKGKFSYMAPEYLGGQLDARADLFALGVIGHELLSNRPLFHATDDMDTLLNLKSMTIPRPSQFRPDLPPELDAIVMTALERNPDNRWQRASALRNALAAEIKRLGLSVLGYQLVEWLDHTFRGQREDSEPDISIHGGTASIAAGSVSMSADLPEPPQRATVPLRRPDSDVATTLVREGASTSARNSVSSSILPLPPAPVVTSMPLAATPTLVGTPFASAPPELPPSGSMRTEIGVGLVRLPPRLSAPPMPVATAAAAETTRNTDSLPAMSPRSSVGGGVIVLLVTALTSAVVYFALLYLT
jgi:eukaryotic-like serine/threonine-protein kinase